MKLNALQAGFNLDHIVLESQNPDALAKFYTEIIMMEFVKKNNDEIICEGKNRKIILRKGKKNKLSYAGFSCRSKKNLDQFKNFIISNNVKLSEFKNYHFKKGSFSIIDPDKNILSFGTKKESKDHYKNELSMPLQHLTFSSKNLERFQSFYCDLLGFKITDNVVHKNGSLATCFLTSNHEHHTIACFKSDKVGIDHHSYEVGKWESIKILCDYFSKKNVKIIWGPGRHGPGNNLFIFIEDLDKNWLEFSAELEVIHDRKYKEWPQSEKTLNLWGKAILRS